MRNVVFAHGLEHMTGRILTMRMHQARVPLAQLSRDLAARIANGVRRRNRDGLVLNLRPLSLSDHRATAADDLAVTAKALNSRREVQCHTVDGTGLQKIGNLNDGAVGTVALHTIGGRRCRHGSPNTFSSR